ncbi:DedA family protein [Actinobacillus delphinicola]|uniref:DedA family integral membrane protein n=1 Tax=Actinobacillus delphinicola TaxID=51161 RepID=A0A448TRH9_9PAST|nr:DedA family protein [Actinobacillus delphinicola]VEJ08609.1 DedA family integral membrane protein [Actinobacillus delphinicola]
MDILISFFSEYGYWAVFLVLVICGFGVPIPEDITLVSGGVISGLYSDTNPHIMLVVSLMGVIVGDSTMYWLGRIYGTKILRFRLMKKVVTLQRLRLVREKFAKYGNWVLFFARFLPGLRAPIYVIAGITNKISYLRFVIIDLIAACISVPIWVYLGHFGATNREWLSQQIEKGQVVVWGVVIAVIIFVAWKWFKTRKNKKA